MIRRLVALGLFAIGHGSAATAQAGGGCAAMIVQPWPVPGGRTYRVAALASGTNCAGANVTLTIKNASGATLLTFTSAAADLPLLFTDVTTPAAMTAALRRWIEQPANLRTTRDFPAWDAAADEPKAGEFMFHPEPLITRARYAELRKWGQPAFCFLQGSESEACYALDGKTDTLTLVGTQSIPG